MLALKNEVLLFFTTPFFCLRMLNILQLMVHAMSSMLQDAIHADTLEEGNYIWSKCWGSEYTYSPYFVGKVTPHNYLTDFASTDRSELLSNSHHSHTMNHLVNSDTQILCTMYISKKLI